MQQMTCSWVWRVTPIALALLTNGACGDGDEGATGSVRILLEPETTVTDGIEAGDGAEDIRDGWTVGFDRYITTIGAIETRFATDQDVHADADEVWVVDLTQIPAAGEPLWEIDGLREGRWELFFSTPGAGDGSARHDSVSQDDYDAMVDNDWTYFIDGVLTKDDGESCPPAALATPGDATPNGRQSGDDDCYDAPSVRFRFGVPAETVFGPCEADGIPGFAVTADAGRSISVTLHGDHLFFNGFPEGDEGGIMRLAQWLADCDLDLDGTVTQAELEAIAPEQLPQLDERYQFGGSPITPLETMYEYVQGQLKTQGHFQGEGECPFDGTAHAHE